MKKTLTRRQKAKRYSSVKAGLALLGVLLSVFSALVFSSFVSDPVFNALRGALPGTGFVYVWYVIIFLFFMGSLAFPLRYINSFFIEKRYGLSSRSMTSWFLDEIKSSLLGFVVSMVSTLFLYAAMARFPGEWWIISAFAWIIFLVAMAFLSPVVIIPLFFKYLSIDPGPIKERIEALAAKTGVRICDVCVVDLSKKTLKANAALVGLAKTRKVILSDTLMDNFTADEVETVMAHEFGHHKLRHIPKHIGFASLSVFLGFAALYLFSGKIAEISGTPGISDIRTLPVIFIFSCIIDFLVMPIRNFFSRICEREADNFALNFTSRPEVFISVMEKLSSMNFSDEDPSLLKKIWLYAHPPISERIAMAWRYKKYHEEKRQ